MRVTGILFGAFCLLVCGPVQSQVDVRDADIEMYPSDIQYNPTIPTPADILGHELGREPVRHHKLVEYITTVAEKSDRLSVEVIGYSHERRPILFVVATSPDNHANLDAIKAAHIGLTEPSSGQTVSDDMPVVTWLNYGVHGAESSGMDASLPFIYYLAAAEGDAIEEVLRNSVILVTAIFNPDGHAQRVSWLDAYGGSRMIGDPFHAEHDFSWTFARTNHYGFDLNRQWLLLTQPEPRAWMKKWHEWRPNLTVDYHEMGSNQTYYFHPGARTRTNPLVPDTAERLMEQTVATSEAFLDGEARLYFHGERFDNFYVGKGSTFPLVNGGVGVLYEAAAALGREIETPNGLRTYRENIRKHFRTSIASIEAADALRVDYLNYQRDFYRAALDEGRKAATTAWVVSADGDQSRLHFFADLLATHRIKTYPLGRTIDADGQTFDAANSLVIPVDQPQHRLIRSIFEAQTEFEDATFYDVSTWTLPPAFGLSFAPLRGRQYRSASLGDATVPAMPVASAPATSGYGYVFEWNAYFAPRALYRALEKGMLVRVATEPFAATTSTGIREFSRGSIVIPFDRQTVERDDIHALVREIAATDGVTVHSLTSGRSATGTAGFDVGGPSFRHLKKPSVLMIMGRDVALYDVGEAWHLLDHRMHIPVSLRDRERMDGINWSRYTHVVFFGGEYEEYDPAYAARMRQWVMEGGTAIAFRSAAPWLRNQTIDWVDPLESEAAPEEEVEEEAPVERQAYGNKSDIEAVEVLGGAIFAADLDITHPLGFGFNRSDIFLHKNVKAPMTPTRNPFGTVIEYAEDPVFSGYVSPTNAQTLAETPALIAERSGAGSVVLFADNPNFRGYWYGTNKLFLNAIFFSKVFDAPRGN